MAGTENKTLSGGKEPLSTKQLAELVYSMGSTFDGLQATFTATEEFLRTGSPRVINSRADYNLLLDLKQAAEFTFRYDYANLPFDVELLKGINAQLTRTAAMESGVLRDVHTPVMVATPLGRYEPPTPNCETVTRLIRNVTRGQTARSDGDDLDRAVRLFVGLSRMQPCSDGNKRTALFMANGLLVEDGTRLTLIVPTADEDRSWFNRELAAYYLNDDQTIINHLATWNRTVRLQVSPGGDRV